MNYAFQFETEEGTGNYPPPEKKTFEIPEMNEMMHEKTKVHLGHATDSCLCEGALKGRQQTRFELKSRELAFRAGHNAQHSATLSNSLPYYVYHVNQA